EVPVAMEDAALRLHLLERDRSRIGREDVEGRGLDALADRPLDGAAEHALVVPVHAEDEAAVDHHPEAVQAADGLAVVTAQVLGLALRAQVLRVEGLEADEEAAQPAGHRLLEQARAE